MAENYDSSTLQETQSRHCVKDVITLNFARPVYFSIWNTLIILIFRRQHKFALTFILKNTE